MSWREKYKEKIITAKQTARCINSDDVIVTSMVTGIPYAILDILYDEIDRLENVRIDMGFGVRAMRLFLPASKGKVNVRSLFLGPIEREFIKRGSDIEIQLLHLSNTTEDRLITHKANVVMMTGSAPDEDGYISLGLCPIDCSLIYRAQKVIIQVNENVPYIRGEGTMVHMDNVTYLVDLTEELYTVAAAPPSDIDSKIASHIVQKVPNGACIQLGIGGIASAVGGYLTVKKDLGIHTEMFVESMVDLLECGAVNNSKKTLCKGLSVIGFALGSKRMYDFLNNNTLVETRPFDWVNNPYIIAQNDNVVSINSALEIDLTGQVCAESIGLRQYSGTGGQVDYVRGATLSKGGMSFIAIPSVRTDKEGRMHSKINLTLPLGAAVTTLRSDVQYIVTEYGIADLRFETIENRVKRLITIAHPDFRDQLMFDAKKAGLIF
ncbi:MAG: 4-hydroxybutyrate--acetyl-CoA CoA transferase [Eubacteriaceae bacterium]|nr:4-hydroxybutyrate--acetyl-CoA CoA transferase [Eubacteriaceae bacterium]